ncbi:MAG: hypothetical protein ACFB2W_20005 [Leptolyngbyaceae cyanobacterium]
MVTFKLKNLGKKSLLALTIVMTIGGIKAASTFVRTADAVVPQTQTDSIDVRQPSSEYLVCSEAASWQRPSLNQQQKQLEENERYSSLLQDKDFQQLSEQLWQHDVLSFTTYGLSARMEPINLSGLWTVAEDVWTNCYSQDEGNAINAGNLAEAWVMNYRVVDVQWQEGQYVLVVTPGSGMQVVQFVRHETEAELPLTVITTEGSVVAHHSADW